MGLFSWLFPSPEQKLERARRELIAGRFVDARDLAREIDLPGAADIVEQAEEALAQVNLAHAVSWAEAGDEERVEIHLDLAREFAKPGMEEAFRAARRDIQRIFSERERQARAEAERGAADLLSVDTRFRAEHGEDEIPMPAGVSDDEADELKARLAILFDNYPEALRRGMIALGPTFAQAVLDLEEGRVQQALPALLALPDDAPLVLHERARAADALGDPAAAARSWQAFARHAGGHHPIGAHHTAALLAQAQAQAGDLDGAFATLSEARKADPELASGLFASLLEARGDLAGAEALLRTMLQRHGAQPSIYLAIARVRLRADRRVEAMQALETSLRQSNCKPGSCGSRPPDLATHRLLAMLYLEDGLETERALELADTARQLVQQPVWEDLYLAALVARTDGSIELPALAERLHQVTPPQDPRFGRLQRYLPLAS
jgi:hypothetical protein